MRNIRFDGGWDEIQSLQPASGGEIEIQRVAMYAIGGGLSWLVAIVAGVVVYKNRKGIKY